MTHIAQLHEHVARCTTPISQLHSSIVVNSHINNAFYDVHVRVLHIIADSSYLQVPNIWYMYEYFEFIR